MSWDMTIASVRRPEILSVVLGTFDHCCGSKPERVFVNIDPVGNGNKDEVKKVCEYYFDNVVFNEPTEPSLTRALKWLFSQTKEEFFVHLEDDAISLATIPVKGILNHMSKNIDIAYCGFSRCHSKPVENFSSPLLAHEYDAGEFWWRSGPYKIATGPGAYRSDFARKVSELLDVNGIDPEVQLHIKNERLNEFVNLWRACTFAPSSGFKSMVDIGKWYRQIGFERIVGEQGTKWKELKTS